VVCGRRELALEAAPLGVLYSVAMRSIMEWKDCSSAVRPVVESVVEGVSSAVKEIFPDMPDCTWPRINEREGVAEDNGFAGDVGCGVFDGLAEYLSWSIEPQQPVDGYVARFDFIFAPRGEEFNRSVGRHEVPWVGHRRELDTVDVFVKNVSLNSGPWSISPSELYW